MREDYNNSKIAIIYNSIGYFVQFFNNLHIPVYQVYKDISLPMKLLRKVCIKMGISKSVWYGAWKAEIQSLDTIIFFSTNPSDSLKYIKKLNPNIRIIFWYWNPVFRNINPNLLPAFCEIWSFDKVDCELYNLKFNTQFYFKDIQLPVSEIVYDVSFVGIDKGRKKNLEHINSIFVKHGIKSYMYIVDNEWNKRGYKGITKPLSYYEYLGVISSSKVLLDYVQEDQHGLTLRPMESIFFRKKLITNNISIINEDFFHESNIFILGIHDTNNLFQFVNSPYIQISDTIIDQYDVQNWLKRFHLDSGKLETDN
jgi:hypothetical protein